MGGVLIKEKILNAEIITNFKLTDTIINNDFYEYSQEETDTFLSVLTDKDQYYFRTSSKKWVRIKEIGHYGNLKIHPIADFNCFYSVYEVNIYYKGYKLAFTKLDTISKEEFEYETCNNSS